MFEDTKWVIRSRKSTKNIQYNEQAKKGQTTIYKTSTGTPLKPDGELLFSNVLLLLQTR